MCGLAGFSGIKDEHKRWVLMRTLGIGIDARGGHAAGYVSLRTAESSLAPTVNKRIGTWKGANGRFLSEAAKGEVLMMHSRFATCGQRDNVTHAHPFVIKREGKSVIYGAHNGVLGGTYGSSAKAKRTHTVDSRELLELMADDDVDGINNLTGYGVVTWITPSSGNVNMVRLSENSDIIVVSLKGGGIAWASTWNILRTALNAAGIEAEHTLVTEEIGMVYQMAATGVYKTQVTGITVGEEDYSRYYSKALNAYGWGDHIPDVEDMNYTAEDAAWDKMILDREKALELERVGRESHYWRPDGKLMARGLEMVQRKSVARKRPLSEITLDNMTEAELGELTDEEWDVICEAYDVATHGPKANKKVRVG